MILIKAFMHNHKIYYEIWLYYVLVFINGVQITASSMTAKINVNDKKKNAI